MLEQFQRMTCALRVLVAHGGDVDFFTKIEEALQLVSSTQMPIEVANWRGSGEGSLECCGFIIASRYFTENYPTEAIAVAFEKKLPSIVGEQSTLDRQTVILAHEGEMVLIDTLCDAFGIDVDFMSEIGEKEPFSFFSLNRDFHASRHRKHVNERVRQQLEDQAPSPAPQTPEKAPSRPSTPVVRTSWRAIVVEGDKEFGEMLRDFLVSKAARQNVRLEVDMRHTVQEAILGLARTPFAISINPRLALAPHGAIEEWGGLEIIHSAKERAVPVILRTNASETELQRALRKRRVKAAPDKIVSVDLLGKLAEEMLACLMRRDH